MNKIVTATEALNRLRQTAEDEPIPSPEDLGQGDLSGAMIQLQNRMAGLTYANEALIDILKAFDIISMDIFDIAYQNVLEYDHSPIESRKLFDIRARALKKKLADYSRSKDSQAEVSPAIPAKSGKRKVKKHV